MAVVLKGSEEIERMRVAGRITAKVCELIVKYISPGMTTAEIDRYAAKLIKAHGARLDTVHERLLHQAEESSSPLERAALLRRA